MNRPSAKSRGEVGILRIDSVALTDLTALSAVLAPQVRRSHGRSEGPSPLLGRLLANMVGNRPEMTYPDVSLSRPPASLPSVERQRIRHNTRDSMPGDRYRMRGEQIRIVYPPIQSTSLGSTFVIRQGHCPMRPTSHVECSRERGTWIARRTYTRRPPRHPRHAPVLACRSGRSVFPCMTIATTLANPQPSRTLLSGCAGQHESLAPPL